MLARVFTLCLCLAYNLVLPALSLAATPPTAREQTIHATPLVQPGCFECSTASRDQWRDAQRQGTGGSHETTLISRITLDNDARSPRLTGRAHVSIPPPSWRHRRCIRSHLGDDTPAA